MTALNLTTRARRTALTLLISIAAAAACSKPAPQIVDVKAADGTVLKGTLFASKEPGPAVLLLHQCDEQRKVWDSLGVRLMKAGISALAVDYRGYGESGGSPHLKLPPAEQEKMLNETWPVDIDSMFVFLERQPGVDTARMAVGGGSCGVQNAVNLAMRERNVKAVAMLAGGVDRAGRAFIAAPGAPPIFTGAAADDRYANFVEIMSWMRGLSSNASSRSLAYDKGGHAAVVFNAHPDLPDSIAKWYSAVLLGKLENLPATTAMGMSADSLKVLNDIDQPNGAARVAAQLADARKVDPKAQLFSEYFVNYMGYEHLQAGDTTGALEILKLNVFAYPDSPNAMDSLGDLYLAMGNKAAALDAARKTITLLDNDKIDTPERIRSIREAAEAKIKQLSSS